jgi:cysteine desulfurase
VRRLPVNFDCNATGPVHPAAWAAYVEACGLVGPAAGARLAGARQAVAAFLGAEADEIHFVSGGTEADAQAIASAMTAGAGPERPRVVTSAIEHAAVSETLTLFEARGQLVRHVLPVPRHGRVAAAAFAAALTPPTRLASLVLACNETGVLQPVAEVADLCRGSRVALHTDAVQAVGRLSVDVRRLGVDLLSLSGHKVGAVGGVGVLYVRRGTALPPALRPECAQPREVALMPAAVSVATALAHLPDPAMVARIEARRDALERALRAEVPDVEVLGAASPRLPNTSCIRFPGCAGDALMMACDVAGYAVSTGSACSSGSIEPSPILLGMGLTRREALETVRFSLDARIEDADVAGLVATLSPLVRRLRGGG